ncbi:hypothetical protein AVEN_244241-1 [Araneus ventricosus]|uniref:Uncharacterized protein n=2 Tax=Araneus ventricosus TaxID=182803 RepID=A0A4Y2WW78_ARAVE|nr:hypothetical protein AVEN_244241-1 [Araneus ventricosus]
MYFYDSLLQRIRMKLHFPPASKELSGAHSPVVSECVSRLEARQEVLEDAGTAPFDHYLTRDAAFWCHNEKKRMDSSISKSFLKERERDSPFREPYFVLDKAAGCWGWVGMGLMSAHLHNNEVDEISWNCNKHRRRKLEKMIFGSRYFAGIMRLGMEG